ncbi:MAG: GNAT family N-acetyltransferase [Bacteroidota bacterium]
MSEVIIRIYSDYYKKSITKLILKIQNEEFGIPITLNQQPDLNQISQFYQAGNGNFWVALLEGKTIGTISLLGLQNRKAALRKMFVDKLYRGPDFGVGQKLLNTLFDWAKQKGIEEIVLGTTERFTAAQRFYEKNGFKEIEKKELPEDFPVMEVDVKFYCIAL